MFTGIITGIGQINSIEDAGDRMFRIGCEWDCSTIDIGASIACSGVCLTVVARRADSFLVTASANFTYPSILPENIECYNIIVIPYRRIGVGIT